MKQRSLFEERSQRAVVWWAVVFATIYGLALRFGLHMFPPPTATWSAERVGEFYREHHDSIRWGAVIASFTSAFMLPLSAVVAVQMARVTKGWKIWSVLTLVSGAMMSIFLVLPPIFFGVAAYTESRAPETTTIMHELGLLTLTTTDQYYIFMWVAIVIVCFLPTDVPHTPFPRWFGYFTAWTATMFEAGAFAFLPRTGLFSWNGLLVFWSPVTLFSAWIAVQAYLLLRALSAQMQDPTPDAGAAPQYLAAGAQ